MGLLTAPLPVDVYFDVLICVARADGRIAPEELRFLREAAEAAGLSGERLDRVERYLDLEIPFDVDQVLTGAAAHLNVSTLAEVIRDAYVIALADAEVAPTEVAVVARLLALVGVAEGPRAAVLEWARLAAEHHVNGLGLLQEVVGDRWA